MSDAAKPTVGFIGVGRMGAPMATNLAAAGYPLVLWNRTAAKAGKVAAETGCEVAASPAEVAARSDLVISMVADGPTLEAIYFDDPAFVEGLEGGLALDMSTIGPAYARRAAARLAEGGVRFAESPVSGSVAAAEAATLTLLVGAGAGDFEALREPLAAIGDPIIHLGEVGAGSLMKLAINSLIYSANQSLAEALVLAERGGVDLELAYDAILASAAAAPVTHYRRPQFLDPEDAPVSFALDLEAKDIGLTAELARELGAPMPQLKLNGEVVSRARAKGYGDRDVAYIAQHLREEPTR